MNTSAREMLLDDPSGEDLARHIITFDPDEPQQRLFAGAESYAPRPPLLPIPWPEGLAPQAAPLASAPAFADPLPSADVLVVTWTVAEAKALADVLTPGYPTTSWYRYGHDFQSRYVPLLRRGAPALESGCLGLYLPCTIGTRRVLCMKFDLHLSQDGPQLPVRALWQQVIQECNPKLVITTGTAGGVGAQTLLGDVVVTKTVQFDCHRTFKGASFANASYTDTAKRGSDAQHFTTAQQTLLPVNATRLPPAPRPPLLITADSGQVPAVLTTDFFAFDDSTDAYGLRAYNGNARAVEMGDAVLGLVCTTDIHKPPAWLIVRNASDPQMDGSIQPLRAQAAAAAKIYEQYGYWTTVGSAITCWAAIAG